MASRDHDPAVCRQNHADRAPAGADPCSPAGPDAMKLADPDIKECKALVIDANPTSRSALINILRDMGVGQVSHASRIVDARQALESRVFDVVVCDYHFDNASVSGQQLLDDLRQAQLLPFSTVFIMVTGECSYL